MDKFEEENTRKLPAGSVKFDIGFIEDADESRVELCVNDECQVKLTIDEARSLAIRIIMAANRAEVRDNLKRHAINLSRADAKPGWLQQALAR